MRGSVDASQYYPGLARLIRAQSAVLGLVDPVTTLTMTTLGRGESTLSVRVDVNRRPRFTARLAYRAEADAPFAQEFDRLALLPAGVGPLPLHLDLSRQYVPYPCAILSFVPGAPRPRWSVADLRTHGATLARVHGRPIPHWGRIGEARERPFDLLQRFHDSLAYWRRRHPALFAIEAVTQLVPPLTAYLAARNDLFTSLSSVALVHGDLCAPNILFDHGAVHYIDWEWMEYGDPALDVAQLGWDIANPPWQLQLVGRRLDAYLEAYQAQRPDASLRQRREVWVVYLKFVDHLHYRTKAHQQQGGSGVSMAQYQAAVERITGSLATQFLT